MLLRRHLLAIVAFVLLVNAANCVSMVVGLTGEWGWLFTAFTVNLMFPGLVLAILGILTFILYARKDLPPIAEWSVMAPAMAGGLALGTLMHRATVSNLFFTAMSDTMCIIFNALGFLAISTIFVLVASWLTAKRMEENSQESLPSHIRYWVVAVGLFPLLLSAGVTLTNGLSWLVGLDLVEGAGRWSVFQMLGSPVQGFGKTIGILGAWVAVAWALARNQDLPCRWAGAAFCGLWVIIFVSGDSFDWLMPGTFAGYLGRLVLIGAGAGVIALLYVYLVVMPLAKRLPETQRTGEGVH
jgi:hypothetical protein